MSIPESQLREVSGDQTHSQASALEWLDRVDPEWVTRIPYHFAKRQEVLVVGRDEDAVQLIATRRPDLPVMIELRRQLDSRIKVTLVEERVFQRLLRQAYDKGGSEATQMVDDLGDEVDLEMLAQDLPEITDLLEAANDAPIVKLINALLSQAIREGASDIHLEAFESRSVVRFRIDGVLKDVVEPQRALHGALVSRLKVMARLDIAEKRLPQDGRMSLRVGDRPIDVRVSTLPTQHGERVVLRLLDKQGSMLNVTELGMANDMRAVFEQLIKSPHGILLVTGPTGSGKTTTLYAGLSLLDRRRLNVLTIEDPIEYDLDGVGQTQVHSKISMTFASGLRSILRQDPDVVLVGEIRDVETAEIAVQASLTGHLVLSTLHTNTAIGAVTRLVDMGVEPFLIASSLTGVLAQRLVRRICPDCRQAYPADEAERELLGATGEIELLRAEGCEKCEYSGYRGRTGIFELVTVDEGLRPLIHDAASEASLSRYVREQTPSIVRNGFDKVIRGETTLDEVLRVTRDR